jgi:hypothetical protein
MTTPDRTSPALAETERDLLGSFIDSLDGGGSPWGSLRTSLEFNYSRGRTDVVALASDGSLLAFEAKLYRWRDALWQAYRNLCFAHRSYVLLPDKLARHALRYSAEFERAGVGICSFGPSGISVLLEAQPSQPLQPWLTSVAASFVNAYDREVKNGA